MPRRYALPGDTEIGHPIGGRLPAEDKALANRKNRRHARVLVHVGGVDADVWPPKLWTDRDVL